MELIGREFPVLPVILLTFLHHFFDPCFSLLTALTWLDWISLLIWFFKCVIYSSSAFLLIACFVFFNKYFTSGDMNGGWGDDDRIFFSEKQDSNFGHIDS